MTEWNEEDHYPNVPGGCHCSVPALCAGSPYKSRCQKLEATQDALVEALERAEMLCQIALPAFNWGASALTADAIRLLNEVPGEITAALKLAKGE